MKDRGLGSCWWEQISALTMPPISGFFLLVGLCRCNNFNPILIVNQQRS